MASPVNDIELTPEQKQRIADAADRVGRPWPEVLESALRRFIDTSVSRRPDSGTKSFYDVMLEDGVIGIVKDAPPDLSTNPKYMEGFGE